MFPRSTVSLDSDQFTTPAAFSNMFVTGLFVGVV